MFDILNNFRIKPLPVSAGENTGNIIKGYGEEAEGLNH